MPNSHSPRQNYLLVTLPGDERAHIVPVGSKYSYGFPTETFQWHTNIIATGKVRSDAGSIPAAPPILLLITRRKKFTLSRNGHGLGNIWATFSVQIPMPGSWLSVTI